MCKLLTFNWTFKNQAIHLEKERDFDSCERREKEKKSLLDSIN